MNPALFMPSTPLVAALDAMRKSKKEREPLGATVGFRPTLAEEAQIAEWCGHIGVSDGDLARECLRRYGLQTVKDIIRERKSRPGYKALEESLEATVSAVERDIEAATSSRGSHGPSGRDKKER